MKRYLLIFLILTLLASCWAEQWDKQEVVDETTVKYVTTKEIQKTDFVEQIKLPWKITASKETSVSSLSSWIIKNINVKVWDQVKAWDVLADIDTATNLANINLNNALVSYNNAVAVYNSTKESLEKNLETAKLQYENAKISYDNTYTSTEKQLELAKAQLDNVDTKASSTNSSNTSLELSEESLKNAKLSLENFLKNSIESDKSLSSKKDSIINSLKVTIEGSLIVLETSLRNVDEVLWITDLNEKLNDDYEIYLWAKNSLYKGEAESLFIKNNQKYEELKSSFQSKDFKSRSEWELVVYYNELFTLVSDSLTMLDKMVLMLNNTIESEKFPESNINSVKQVMVSFQTQFTTLKWNLTTIYSSYIDIVNSISNTDISTSTQKATLEQAVKLAEANYNNTKANISSTESTTKIQYETTLESVKSARETALNALKIAENQYNASKANYDAQLVQLKTQIDGSSWQKNSYSQQIENSLIKAPYDWVVIARNIEIGSSIWQGTIAFTIATSTQKIVKLEVNVENVKYLKIWDNVTIKKGDLETQWVVALVWAWVSTSSMYPVEINFNSESFANSAVLWDFVDVLISKELWNENIIMPFSALIVNSNWTHSVFVVDSWNLVVKKNVEIWASNSSEIIVKSGLEVWDRIVVSWALNIWEGDKVEEME